MYGSELLGGLQPPEPPPPPRSATDDDIDLNYVVAKCPPPPHIPRDTGPMVSDMVPPPILVRIMGL